MQSSMSQTFISSQDTEENQKSSKEGESTDIPVKAKRGQTLSYKTNGLAPYLSHCRIMTKKERTDNVNGEILSTIFL